MNERHTAIAELMKSRRGKEVSIDEIRDTLWSPAEKPDHWRDAITQMVRVWNKRNPSELITRVSGLGRGIKAIYTMEQEQ